MAAGPIEDRGEDSALRFAMAVLRSVCIDQWRADATKGRLLETMACGTAAVVTPVGTVLGPDGEFTIGSGGIGQMTNKIRERLVGIQKGTVDDSHGWTLRLD